MRRNGWRQVFGESDEQLKIGWCVADPSRQQRTETDQQMRDQQYNKLVIFKNLSSMVCTKTIGLDHVKSIFKIQVINGWTDPCVIMEDKPNKRRQETEERGKDYQMRRWESCGQHLAPDKGKRGRERSQIKKGGFSSDDTKLLSCWLQGAASLAQLDWQQKIWRMYTNVFISGLARTRQSGVGKGNS